MTETATLGRPDPAAVGAVRAVPAVESPSVTASDRGGRTRVERAVRGPTGGGR
ncbi:MAG: hypothetical protein V5A31_05720 [Haloferacaceae archaeon]